MRYIALFLLASIAQAADERTVEWRMLPELELQEMCARQPALSVNTKTVMPPANGCYRATSGKCIIYTRIISPINEGYVHETMGHELRHCFQGSFH